MKSVLISLLLFTISLVRAESSVLKEIESIALSPRQVNLILRNCSFDEEIVHLRQLPPEFSDYSYKFSSLKGASATTICDFCSPLLGKKIFATNYYYPKVSADVFDLSPECSVEQILLRNLLPIYHLRQKNWSVDKESMNQLPNKFRFYQLHDVSRCVYHAYSVDLLNVDPENSFVLALTYPLASGSSNATWKLYFCPLSYAEALKIGQIIWGVNSLRCTSFEQDYLRLLEAGGGKLSYRFTVDGKQPFLQKTGWLWGAGTAGNVWGGQNWDNLMDDAAKFNFSSIILPSFIGSLKSSNGSFIELSCTANDNKVQNKKAVPIEKLRTVLSRVSGLGAIADMGIVFSTLHIMSQLSGHSVAMPEYNFDIGKYFTSFSHREVNVSRRSHGNVEYEKHYCDNHKVLEIDSVTLSQMKELFRQNYYSQELIERVWTANFRELEPFLLKVATRAHRDVSNCPQNLKLYPKEFLNEKWRIRSHLARVILQIWNEPDVKERRQLVRSFYQHYEPHSAKAFKKSILRENPNFDFTKKECSVCLKKWKNSESASASD